jgi:hypothetical protein
MDSSQTKISSAPRSTYLNFLAGTVAFNIKNFDYISKKEYAELSGTKETVYGSVSFVKSSAES